jgi:hypothetical protein
MTKTWVAGLFLAPSVLLSPSLWAQPAIAPPNLGFVEDSARALRPAYGLAGNFILGPSVATKIVSEAFSGSIGLLKTDSSLAAFDSHGKLLASMNSAHGPAIFAFSPSGATALAYIASGNALVEWRGAAFAPLAFNYQEAGADAVLAIAFPTPFEASLIVQRKDTIWELNFPLGAVGTASQKALAGVRAPLLALPSGDLIYSDAGGIVVRRTDASEVHVAASLPASFSLQQMNQDWVQLTDLHSNARFAIRTAPGREGFYQLPESSR